MTDDRRVLVLRLASGGFMVCRFRTRWAKLVVSGVLLASFVGASAETTPTAPSKPTDAEATAQCAATTDPAVCMSLAFPYASSYASPAEQTKAVPFLERACALGMIDTCHAAGEAYASGKINMWPNALLVHDDAMAAKYFRIGCEAGSAFSCDGLGQLLIAGRAGPADPGAAFAAFEKGCAIEDYVMARPDSCLVLGKAHSAGGARATDPALAMLYFDRACGVISGTSPAIGLACLEAGRRFETGAEGVEINALAALNRYETACKAGNPDGCLEQNRLASGETGQEQRAIELAAEQDQRAKQAPVCQAIWQESVDFRAAADAEGDALLAKSDRDSAASDGSVQSRKNIMNRFTMESDDYLERSCLRLLDLRYRAIMACSKEDGEAISELLLADARAARAAMSNRADSPMNCFYQLRELD